MTTETAPIRKLYKRCKRGRHADCPGSFDAYSVCECDCHGEAAAAVETAQAIVTAPAAAAPKRTRKGKVECYAVATVRHESDYTLRGVKDHSSYAFFDPCDEHAIEENAVIIAFGRSEHGAAKQVAANAISRLLVGCEVCKQRTCNAMAAWASTQADVAGPEAFKLPPRNRPTRMSRDTFIAKYDRGDSPTGGTVLYGSELHGDTMRSAINRCANRECVCFTNNDARKTALIVLHDTQELCGSCVLAGVKPKRRK